MKWSPSGVGAEPKKLAVLAVLLAGGGVAYYFSSRSAIPDQQATASTPAPQGVSVPPLKKMPAANDVPQAAPPMPAHRTTARNRELSSGDLGNFHVSLKVPEDTDLSKVDPTLHEDLLAKLQKVPMEGGSRSLFEFGKPPEPPAPPVTIKPGPAVAEVKPVPPAPKADDKPPPPPPPIPLKFYGYAGTTKEGLRRAFFLEGDDIYTPAENETVKGRYKIVRIGVNSAVVEDTQNKNQQTLPLVEEMGG